MDLIRIAPKDVAFVDDSEGCSGEETLGKPPRTPMENLEELLNYYRNQECTSSLPPNVPVIRDDDIPFYFGDQTSVDQKSVDKKSVDKKSVDKKSVDFPPLHSESTNQPFQLPQPERVCIFGTDGTKLITDEEVLKNRGYFGRLDESRTNFDYPLNFEDYQKSQKNLIFQDTTWLENATENNINKNLFTMFIRYNQLNAVLCTIDGTFRENITLLVRWKKNTVSLFNKGYTYRGNLELAAVSYYLSRENRVGKDEKIYLGKNVSYAAYKIIYDNQYSVITSKNADCRSTEGFSTNMPLVELKLVRQNAYFNLGPARRLKCFTDIPTKKVEYQKTQKDGKDCFTNLQYENIESSDPEADQRDHYFVRSLSMVLDERKNDEDKVVSICFGRRPKACVMTTKAGSIYIYDMATDSPEQRATSPDLHEGKHLIDILPFYRH